MPKIRFLPAALLALSVATAARADRVVDFQEATPGIFVDEWVEEDVVFTSAGPSMLLSFASLPGGDIGIYEPSANTLGFVSAQLPALASSVTCSFNLELEVYTLTAFDSAGIFVGFAAVVGDPGPFNITELTVTAPGIDRIEFGGGIKAQALTTRIVIVEEVTCVEDVDGDGTIGFSDVLAILAAWGDEGGPADVDGNGLVGFGDVLAVLAAWGACP